MGVKESASGGNAGMAGAAAAQRGSILNHRASPPFIRFVLEGSCLPRQVLRELTAWGSQLSQRRAERIAICVGAREVPR
jgi:hypothetical protein